MIQSKYELLQKKLTNHNLLSKNDNLSLDNDSDWLDIQKIFCKSGYCREYIK
jgi:hypothetical protein